MKYIAISNTSFLSQYGVTGQIVWILTLESENEQEYMSGIGPVYTVEKRRSTA